jgi:hypothetical protein
MSVEDSLKKNKCRHFTGLCENHCKKGVNYQIFNQGEDHALGLKIPCITVGRSFEHRNSCDYFNPFTKKELENQERVIEMEINKLKKALPLITEIKNKYQRQDWSGVEKCPVCGNDLYISHAGANGHVWASCKTENCIEFKE